MTLPKAELHLHFEGAIRAATAAELADRSGRQWSPTSTYPDLAAFVRTYESARDLVETLDDLRRIARELVEDAAAQGVVWSEVHLVPPTYGGRLGHDEAVLEAVLDGFAAGSGPASAAGVIIGVNRGLPLEAAGRSLRLATAYADAGVVGLGLAGDEAGFPAALFTDVFARARDAGLRALPHAGEGAGPGSVRACVEELGAARINHGVRAIEDPGLVELLAERAICLDVCPSSNIALSVYSSMAEHPLPRLLAAGVPVSLGSDCPLFVGRTVVDEYRLAIEHFGLGPADVARIAHTSLTASSCPPDRRDTALAALSRWG
ncbi:adenosine deaminase [Pseudonocardia sp. TRM90224]|uniref:adenosine deaminase n=1 Tax=Pseudonocardia sp. TRM90224 TaxID=2812678 RepID=UPI001E62FC3C|nr:adenosine deaminase [Pseudonocardia sp. TRM90224]